MSRLQRKFNGPLQQIGGGDVAKSTTAINQQNSNQQKNSKLAGKSAPPPPPPPYMRTFSQPEPTPSQRAAANDSKDEDGESVGDGMHDEDEVRNTEDEDDEDPNYSDNADNIYDTVAPDQEEEGDEYDSEGDLLARDDHHHQQHISRENLRRADRGEEEEEGLSSSHEMLSRSSSTDEGLSNYVNIDYFLRKSSLGRSSSNIPGGPSVPSSFPPSRAFRGNGRKKSSLADIETEDTADDAETNLSSMKSSSDYDNSFSSSENIIDGLLPPYHHQQQQHGHGHYQHQQQQQQNYHHQQQPQQQQQSMVNSNSLRSFNSSTLSSTGSASTPSGSLRTRSLKGNNSNSNDQTSVSPSSSSSTYPPNMSTFTPPIRDRGQAQFTFFKGEKEVPQETTTTTDLGAADLPISPIPPPSKVSAAVKQFGGNRDGGSRKASQASSKSNSTGSVCEYYAYTDILESCKWHFFWLVWSIQISNLFSYIFPVPSHERKASSGGVGNELADESLVMENKPLGGGGGSGDNLTDSPSLESSKLPSPSQYNQSSSNSSLSRSEVEQCRTMQWKIIRSIIESETVYLDCLNTLQQVRRSF